MLSDQTSMCFKILICPLAEITCLLGLRLSFVFCGKPKGVAYLVGRQDVLQLSAVLLPQTRGPKSGACIGDCMVQRQSPYWHDHLHVPRSTFTTRSVAVMLCTLCVVYMLPTWPRAQHRATF